MVPIARLPISAHPFVAASLSPFRGLALGQLILMMPSQRSHALILSRPRGSFLPALIGRASAPSGFSKEPQALTSANREIQKAQTAPAMDAADRSPARVGIENPLAVSRHSDLSPHGADLAGENRRWTPRGNEGRRTEPGRRGMRITDKSDSHVGEVSLDPKLESQDRHDERLIRFPSCWLEVDFAWGRNRDATSINGGHGSLISFLPMPRAARKAPGGHVYHVLNRSVGRMHLFGKNADFEAFQRVMIERTSDTRSASCPTASCRTTGTSLSGRRQTARSRPSSVGWRTRMRCAGGSRIGPWVTDIFIRDDSRASRCRATNIC